MRVPNDAAAGFAKITLSIPDWKEENVTPATLNALVIGGSQDVPAVQAALQTDNPVIRQEIISALSRFGPEGEEVVQVLVEQFEDEGPEVHDAAARAIVSIDRTAIGSLVKQQKISLETALRALGAKSQFESGKLTHVEFVRRSDFIDDDLKLLQYSSGDLREVNVYASQITSDGVRHLQGLKNLTTLGLAFNPIGNDGLAHVKGLTNLRVLNLRKTQITDDGLQHVKNLSNLRLLALAGNQITDDGLRHLVNLTNLTELGLSGNGITDEGIVHLKKLKNLRRLYVSKNQITSSGLIEWKRQLPDCSILAN